MVFINVGKVDCSNAFKGINIGFGQLFYQPNRLITLVQRSANQEDSVSQATSCSFCLLFDFIAKKQTLDEADAPSKKLKLDPTMREEFPRFLSVCEKCSKTSDDTLKGSLKNIISFWFKDSNSIWKVKSNFRRLISANRKILPTFEWVLFCNTSTTLTLVTIPITTTEDSSLLMNKSFAFVYNQQEKVLCAYIQADFSNTVPLKALVHSKDEINNIFQKLTNFGKTDDKNSKQTLSLVNKQSYHQLHQKLKDKYFSYFVNIWSGITDPFFFIYKGISVATYILLLWEEERSFGNLKGKQSFIDLKCGNGLLVHILSSEGHPGKGIDVVKNKMWDNYGSGTLLEESIIYPHKLKVEADWIISYNADELSPWIPIIAARSSYSTKFFWTPSFFYHFDQIIKRSQGYFSDYNDYIEYVTGIGEECGFTIEQDELLLKVKKRNCLIGRCRSSKVDQTPRLQETIDEVVKSLLKRHSCLADLDEEETSNGYSFKIIKKQLKDYTELNDRVKSEIFDEIIKTLLLKENFGHTSEDNVTSSGHKWSEWNAGDRLPITGLEKLVDPNLFKDNSGGMLAILQIYKNVFNVTNGMVSLQDYRRPNGMRDIRRYLSGKHHEMENFIKVFGCWFYRCHPQGCVLKAEECQDSHGVENINLFHHF